MDQVKFVEDRLQKIWYDMVDTSNVGKYGPEKLLIETLFTQWRSFKYFDFPIGDVLHDLVRFAQIKKTWKKPMEEHYFE